MTSFTSTMPEETVTAAATRLPLQAGDPQFAGNYRLTARLGSGGMGVVYRGEAGDGRLVAVKVMRPELAGDPEFRARFSREAVALTRVESARVVRVIEAGTDTSGPFLVTEYAAGPSLAGHIDLNGPFNPSQVSQLAAGLARTGCPLDQPGRAVLDTGGHLRDHPAAAWRPGLRPHRHRERVPGRRPGPGPRRPHPGDALDLGRRRDLAADDGRAGRAG